MCETKHAGWRQVATLTALAALAASPRPAAAVQNLGPQTDPVAVVPVAAPVPDPVASSESEALAAVPFGPGERLVYQVKLGVMSAGEGWIVTA